MRIAIILLASLSLVHAAPLPKDGPGERLDAFSGRRGKLKATLLQKLGGAEATEAAVQRGLDWLAGQQHADGHWALDGDFPDKGMPDDIAGTALALLPFLGAGVNHLDQPAGARERVVAKGLEYLIRQQNEGSLASAMYSHGLGAMALCEAYGMSHDPKLKEPAQKALDYIVKAQHDKGGWRYQPGQPGDTSVTGFMVQALKTGQWAGLQVPDATVKNAIVYLDSVCDRDERYGYTSTQPSPTMTAVGLLCRQYLQKWGAGNERLQKGVQGLVMPDKMPSVYYHYFAAQVHRNTGGKAWEEWNKANVEQLLITQEKGQLAGSWSTLGDNIGAAGGRIFRTSWSLLTLQVYYRFVLVDDDDFMKRVFER